MKEQKFYLDIDVHKNKFYVTPSPQIKNQAFIIEFDNRYLAEKFLKDLLLDKFPSPLKNESTYQLIETIKNKIGQIKIYKFKA